MLIIAMTSLALARMMERRVADAHMARLREDLERERVVMWQALLETPMKTWGPGGTPSYRLVYEAPPVVTSTASHHAGGLAAVADGHRANVIRCRVMAADARREVEAATARVKYYDTLAMKYERAAQSPGLPVEQDPPVPR